MHGPSGPLLHISSNVFHILKKFKKRKGGEGEKGSFTPRPAEEGGETKIASRGLRDPPKRAQEEPERPPRPSPMGSRGIQDSPIPLQVAPRTSPSPQDPRATQLSAPHIAQMPPVTREQQQTAPSGPKNVSRGPKTPEQQNCRNIFSTGYE